MRSLSLPAKGLDLQNDQLGDYPVKQIQEFAYYV